MSTNRFWDDDVNRTERNSGDSTFEDRYGPIRRRVERVRRGIRWHVKRLLGRPRTVLVEIRWRLGDEIMALPIYEALARTHQNIRVEVLCNYPELLPNRPGIRTACNESNPDRYVLLRGVQRDVYRLHFYAQRTGVPLSTDRPHVPADQWHSPLEDELPRGSGPLVALATGASWPTKQWPHWRALSRTLAQKGCRLIELGNSGESIGMGVDFTGRTEIRDAAVLLRHADLLVACDSGLMHLALAVGTPVVALFGPSAPDIVVRNEPNFHPLTNNRPCTACWNVSQTMREPGVCPLGVTDCMATLTVDQVIDVVSRIIGFEGERCASSF